MMGPFRIAVLGCLVLGLFGDLQAQPPPPEIRFSVIDRDALPVPGARIEISLGTGVVGAADTDLNGRAFFPHLPAGRYTVTALKDGFEPFRKDDLQLSGAAELTLVPAARHDRVEVHATVEPVEQGAAPPMTLDRAAAKALPDKPATVADALPMIPGVVRNAAGDVQISDSGEHRSALIVNSADVTDPATGQFGLTVPIDSVQTLSVFQTPFLAEYGRFTAGVVSVETRRGGDEWKWEINDPFPDFRIYSWHLRGVRDATPRLNTEGPLVRNRLYFSEGLEYETRNIEVHTLPYPANLTRKAGVNSFAQLDWVQSARNLVTATVHVAPQRLGFFNLDYFNPQPATPDASTHNYTGTVADRLTLAGGLLENTLSVTRFDARVWPQGPADLNIAPWGNSGNYFSQQDRAATRIGWAPTYSVRPLTLAGSHGFKFGAYIASSGDQGEVVQHPVNLLDSAGRTFERIEFSGGRPFQMTDTEYAFFGQDHWSISSRVAADLGLRTESQEVSRSFRMAPRAGLAWVPFSNSGTVIRGGFGLFYDRVPLNVYSFNHYPRRVVTTFDETGAIVEGPDLYGNSLGVVDVHSFWFRHARVPGNFSPRSATASLYLEQTVGHNLKLRAGYMRNYSAGLVDMILAGPEPGGNKGLYELSGGGDARYRQFEVTARVQSRDRHQFFFSYVRSRGRGDLNDFADYLGSFPLAVIRPNLYGSLPGDLPNRYLAWGLFHFPLAVQLAPVFEYRNGFPYSTIDAHQDYVGAPNQARYPNFLSLDSRLSKDVRVSPKYTVRVSLVSYNLTNHFNPIALHNNVADAAYGLFFGSRGRRFTADFDVLF